MGMHRVDKKTYTFNDDITYFIGENGSGKSTILEATQLGLLGYIPGYAKTNESIMKHASGPVMSIELELDNGLKLTRSWVRSGSSVKASYSLGGSEEPASTIEDMIGSAILPVFDFNEFRSMTANKLKDWFISFLPSADCGIDIKQELKDAMGSRTVPYDYLIEETEVWIKESHIETPVELVRELNKKFKEDQSFIKGQIANLEGTIKSLIKYDDADDFNADDVTVQIKELEALKTQRIQYDAASQVTQRAQAALEALKKELPAEKLADDPRIEGIKKQIEEFTKKNDVLKADYADLQGQILDLERQKRQLTQSADTCPYTHQFCQTAADLANKTKEQAAEIDKQIAFKRDEMKECDPSLVATNDREILKLNASYGAIQAQYDKLAVMQLQLDNSITCACPTEKTSAEIDTEILELQNKLVKIKANERYEALSDKVTADKFKFENELEVYKAWAKLTDANGLQTTLMNKPFENLAGEMSSYLTQMFNRPVTAKFNLISKANSFSFGLEQDGQYIEFDYLSSGERCLFTLALIMCILNKSESKIRTILIDDILDHLDSDNASYLFGALKNVENIQFILAGVKECADESICKQVS